ncbi:phage terminase small subunit [Dehalobacter restrictus]|uniref:phage terminase small subunit n=1 Tax=Dehalobacter restrictus TaxID=55583 RepID=UPI00338FD8E9
MAKEKNPLRDKAFEIFRESNGSITNREIANILEIPERTVSVWKLRDKWNDQIDCSTSKNKNCSTTKRKHGGQPKNKNAKGHGAPVKNKNAETHGFFSKYLPDETLEIMQVIQEKHPLDILWENITIQYAAIVRAQKIMYVKDQKDLTEVLKRQKESSGLNSDGWEKEYELQFAWDKHATFLQAQSRAMKTLEGMIKQYDELSRSSLATEEQKERINKLRAEVAKIKGEGAEIEDLTETDADIYGSENKKDDTI